MPSPEKQKQILRRAVEKRCRCRDKYGDNPDCYRHGKNAKVTRLRVVTG